MVECVNRMFKLLNYSELLLIRSYFWDEVKNVVLSNFKEGKHAQGLTEGIIKAGNQLKAHFPYQDDDVNELDNEISFGND